MLPFKYGILDANEFKKSETSLKVSGFEYDLDISTFENDKFEIKSREYRIFPQRILSDGFLILESIDKFKVRIFGCDLDGNLDGLYEEIEIDQTKMFCVEIHHLMRLGLKATNADIFGIHLKKKNGTRPWNRLLTSQSGSQSILSNIKETHISPDNIAKSSDSFYENSYLTIPDFMTSHPKAPDFYSWIPAGPADYRNFKYIPLSSKLCNQILSIFNSRAFMFWLEDITGLPIKRLSRPTYLRKIQNAGDYQILHGNYFEPLGLDLIYNFYGDENYKCWEEDICGRIHYLDENGNEIFQVPVLNNSLTIIYRTQGTSRFLENLKGMNNEPLIQAIALYEIEDEE